MFDLPLAELERYQPNLAIPNDFDAFWKGTPAETRGHDLDQQLQPYDLDLPLVDCQDLTLRGLRR